MKLPKTGKITPLPLGERLERGRDRMARKIGGRKRKKRLIRLYHESLVEAKNERLD